ncbi:MAG: hypothetical protein AAF658_01615, partial [Myxococcota bacterium]
MKRLYGSFAAMMLCLACSNSLELDPNARISCPDGQCPTGYVCRETIGLCIPTDTAPDAPEISGTATITPEVASQNVTVSVDFTTSVALFDRPSVRFGSNGAEFTFDPEGSDETVNRYVFFRTIDGTTPSGLQTVVVDLVSQDGLAAVERQLGTVTLDFEGPEL